ncbi:MarR family winged helix-turn-helix transcriptional regulator [Streptomyces lanatus]|uniref:MarR family transcriptional regulator n=1 Tax=Streptomyces lanatus TaxID=66900 RepID=A0ABV1XPU6_9ACTN|nr:MarR family transcriptional regulator [Streptomyces lanatus]GHG87027.1 MarR family transcriptional regulator [Streptomyces lanatus]
MEQPEDTAHALAEIAGIVVRSLADRRGMSFTTASTLGRLEREGPARLTVLAAAEGVAQPSMTQLVQRLEQQGLASRISDPDDGRVSLVAITDAGRTVLAERRREREARLVSLLATLPEDERQALGAAMGTALPLVRRMVNAAERAGHGHRGDN